MEKEATFLKRTKEGNIHLKKGAGFQLMLITAKVPLWLEREPRTEGRIQHFSKDEASLQANCA